MIKTPAPQKIGLLFVIYYSVGIAGLSIPSTNPLFTQLTPFSLLLSLAVLLWYHKQWKRSHLLVFLLIGVIGYLVEVAGVLTGEVFGHYSYGKTLGYKLFDTPLMIGVNWFMLIYCVHTLYESTKWPRWLRMAAGALSMVIYDIIMEPVAIQLDMWSWGGGTIPLQNYIAWFVISFFLLFIMQLAAIRTQNRVAIWLLGVQAAFFLLLNLIL